MTVETIGGVDATAPLWNGVTPDSLRDLVQLLSDASYHFADDSAGEWGTARKCLDRFAQTVNACRLTCCIPGCRRTTAKPFAEWICGKHWIRIPKAVRRVYQTARRRRKSPAALARLWTRCKRIATERNFTEMM